MNKRAYFFSLDAFIALLVILGVIFFIKPSSVQISQEMNLQNDLLLTLSSVKVGEIDNSYVQQLIADEEITNLNQSVLEQIGEFYASSNPEAELLAENIIDNLGLEENIGLYFNGIPIATSSVESASDSDNVWTSRQIISGIQQGNSSKGYSSRAFLFSENKVAYFYFGGYVGDGNITMNLGEDVASAKIEAVFSGNFDLYVNNVFINSNIPETGVPYTIEIAEGNFSAGENSISFKSGSPLYIAGGYIKAIYNNPENFSNDNKIHLPGIKGLINLYDGFYVPETLNDMEIFLHYKSPHNLFVDIGKERVYLGNSGGTETTLTLSDAQLSGMLSYAELSDKTIPIRIGLENISYLSNFSVDVDVFSVTDLSGSMNEETGYGKMIDLAKSANEAFIEYILNYSGNRIGLVGYAWLALESDYHSLSNNEISLMSKMNEWETGGGTCICCGINKAGIKMAQESSPEKIKSMVVMSDGKANVKCSAQGTGSATQDAIQAACDAYNDYGIIVHAVGFGDGADVATLQAIANCGHGNYYYGEISQLVEIYRQIAEDVIKASYSEQTVLWEDIDTELFSDSYISLGYDKIIPYGLIITSETDAFGNQISEGSFEIPDDTSPHEARVISYSGSKWTDNVEVYNNFTGAWENTFNLSVYNLSYVNLGDPYAVNIPLDKIHNGINSVRVSTGLNSINSSGGSVYDKIIYSIVKGLSSYSPIVSSKEGCAWTIEFEDGTNATMNVPSNYSGTKQCYFTSSNIAYNNNDAIDNAIFNLLSSLDLNSNRKLETKFSENDLTIDSVEVDGIPFTWETEVQARVWR
jgi:hypothetical protein